MLARKPRDEGTPHAVLLSNAEHTDVLHRLRARPQLLACAFASSCSLGLALDPAREARCAVDAGS